MKNPKISVIVTCYNNVKYIDECLGSLKNQIFKEFEALIIDDGSTDGSSEIIDKYVAEDERFKLFRTEHIGFPLAKNIGLDNAKGDYIIFLDSDDVAFSSWLLLLYTIAIESKADITTCNYVKVPLKKEDNLHLILNSLPITEYNYSKMTLLFHSSCFSYMWNKLIKKELYEDIRHKDQIALSDVSVMYKIFHKANKIIQLKKPLIYYRQHKESMSEVTKNTGPEYYTFRLNVLKEVCKFIFDNYPQSRYITQTILIWKET